jgi:uncharacterized membrane protein YjjP (DUF1212 family)
MAESSPLEDERSSPALEKIAALSLEAGRMLMESGAKAASVEKIVNMVAHGLGAERVDVRVGFASLDLTVMRHAFGITRLSKVGNVGVNQRLNQELWRLAKRVSRRELTAEETDTGLQRIKAETPLHNTWLLVGAVGLACAAFGLLLGVDVRGSGAVFVAASIGQFVRRKLLANQVNPFICTTVVSFLSSLIGSIGARWAGSQTITLAMIASTLLLVPGIPAVNAQSDILEGYPTIGTARAVSVAMTLLFIAIGIWIGPMLLNVWH